MIYQTHNLRQASISKDNMILNLLSVGKYLCFRDPFFKKYVFMNLLIDREILLEIVF